MERKTYYYFLYSFLHSGFIFIIFIFYVVSFILYDHNTKAPGIRSFTYDRRVWHRLPRQENRRLLDIVATKNSFSRLRFPLRPFPSHRRGILLTAFVMKKKEKK